MSAYHYLSVEYNVRVFNEHNTLDLIQFSIGNLPHTDISGKLGLMFAAISSCKNDLVESGAINVAIHNVAEEKKINSKETNLEINQTLEVN